MKENGRTRGTAGATRFPLAVWRIFLIAVIFISFCNLIDAQLNADEQFHFVSNNGSHTDVTNISPSPSPTPLEGPKPEQPIKTRPLLPKHTRPSRYNITISIDFNTTSFTGEETIEVQVLNETSTIEIHSEGLNISYAAFLLQAQQIELVAKSINYDKQRQTALIDFDQRLPITTKAVLALRYQGLLAHNMDGLYLSHYTATDPQTGEEVTRNLAVTQFEPVAARKAFPCWDEPAIKAVFELTINAPEGYTVISNMPLKALGTHPNLSGYNSHSFDPSPIMSTYLVAIVVGNFDYVEGETKEGVKIRVYTPPEKKFGNFASDVAARTLSYFTEYFGIPYPLPKLDLIAVPDFSAGAMENWGCVTFREALLLVNESTSSVATKQAVTYVTAHELAHQWFGNLVTMEWWTDLWLNEGFATWVGNLAMAHLFPEWDTWTQFTAHYFREGLLLDGLANSHAVHIEVGDPGEIGEIFDAISYNKGASVIRMLANYLGQHTFQEALHLYLDQRVYQNAITEDLWTAVSTISHKPIGSLMHVWLKETGYPIVSIDLDEVTGDITVKQRRFLSSGQQPQQPQQSQQSQQQHIWWLPLTFTTSNKEVLSFSLFDDAATINSDTQILLGKEINWETLQKDSDWWIKANFLQTGFFRVKYSEPLLKRLGTALKGGHLRATDRLGIVDDAFALAIAGEERTWNVLELVSHFSGEEDYTVWSTLTDNLRELLLVWKQYPHPDIVQNIELYIHRLYEKIYHKLGWEATPGEDNLNTLLRGIVIGQLVRANHSDVILEAQRRFRLAFDTPKDGNTPAYQIPPDLVSPIYDAVISSGTEEAFRAIQQRYRTAAMQEERVRCLASLGKTPNAALVKEALQFGLSVEVRRQDTFYLFGTVGQNLAAVPTLWNFVKERYDELRERYTPILLGRIISFVSASFSSEEQAVEYEGLFVGKDTSGIERTIKQGIEKIRTRAKWLQQDGNGVANWLNSFQQIKQ